MKKRRFRKLAAGMLLALVMSLAFGTTTYAGTGKTDKKGTVQTTQTVTQNKNTQKTKTIKSVYKKLKAFKSKSGYREGTRWDDSHMYLSRGFRSIGYGCAAFVMDLSDSVYGSKPVETVYDHFTYQSGDIIHFDGHFVIVLKATSKTLTVAEANYGGRVHWGRKISVKTANNTAEFVWKRN